MQSKLLMTALMLAAFSPMQINGHHSHGNYNMLEYKHLTGTVTEVHWVNPHSWVFIEVADEQGEAAIWALEAAAATTLTRQGLSADTIATGDTVSVRCHQLRDGANGCLLGFLTPEGGVEVEWD